MAKKTGYLALLFLSLSFVQLSAQNSPTLYFMNLPQRNLLNPAIHSTNKVYVGLPVVSDIDINIDNNFLSLSSLFTGGVISDSTFAFMERGEDLDNFIAGLKETNSIEPQVAIQLFGLGFTVGNDLYISLNLIERADINLAIPGSLIKLGLLGSDDMIGKRLDFSSLRGDLKYYHEAGIGVSKNITDRLRIGVNAKLLFGVAAASLQNDGLGLMINNDQTSSIDSRLTLNMCGPFIVNTDEGTNSFNDIMIDDSRFDSTEGIVSFFTNMGNQGFGLDLGAEYRITDKLAVSAAVNDLGLIKWKTDRVELYTDGELQFNGQSMQDVYDETISFEDMMEQLKDTVLTALMVTPSPAPFTTYLSPRVTVAAGFDLTRFLSFGLVSQTKFIGKQIHEALTLSTNLNFGSAFSTTLAYTAANTRYDNVGFGIAFRGGYAQFFALVDNIPLKWTKMSNGESTIPLPEHLNTIHARIGLNLVFGNKPREEISFEE